MLFHIFALLKCHVSRNLFEKSNIFFNSSVCLNNRAAAHHSVTHCLENISGNSHTKTPQFDTCQTELLC